MTLLTLTLTQADEYNPQYRGAFELSKWVGFIQYLSLWGSVLDFICV